jgi:hypothetical protein
MNVIQDSSRPSKNTRNICFVGQWLFIFPSTKRFGISMVMFFIGPLRASINMLFNGQGTIPHKWKIMLSFMPIPSNTSQH